MIKYPADYNPIAEYWEQIESGTVAVSTKVRKTYKHLMDQMVVESGEYYYSSAKANRILEFIENFCHHSKGKLGGQLIRLELWEKALLAAVFGFVDIEGNRQYREALLIVGKKNGKSLLSSCVGNYMLMADGESGPDVYAVATTRDQAKIVWSEAKRMIKKSPALNSRVRALLNTIFCDGNDGSFRPLASDSDTLDGLNVYCALMDEVHQWKRGVDLYNIIADGVTAREQPLIFMTSTAGVVREDIYDAKYEEAEKVINGYDDPDGYHDDRFLPLIYELDSRSEWTDPDCWIKANPGLGTIKSATQLEEKVNKAKANPMLVKNLICKEFNIRETSSEAWLTYEQLDNRDTYDLDIVNRKLIWHHDGEDVELSYPRYGIGGADLSETTDLTAGKVIFRVPECEQLFVLSMYWIPQDLIEKRVAGDKVPYDIWQERGLVRGCEGAKVSHHDVTEWFRYVQDELDIYIAWFGYDPWHSNYWVDEMVSVFGPSTPIAVTQGKKTLSLPMKILGRELEAKHIVYSNNPIDKWCLANTGYDEDVNGNIQPHKTSRSNRRIDGTAALLDAYTVFLDRQDEYLEMI